MDNHPKVDDGVTLRLLSIEVRPQRFGFVVLDGTRLLEWGVRGCQPAGESLGIVAGKRLDAVIDLYRPALVLIRKRSLKLSPRAQSGSAAITEAIRSRCGHRSTELRWIAAETVRAFFADQGAATKHAVASLLAEWFEELIWKVPPKRKPWQSERYNTLMFDALATAIAFLGRT